MNNNQPKLYTIKEFVKKYESTTKFPTEAMLKNWINKRNINGFDKVLCKAGRLNLIDEDKFFEWIRNNSAK